MSIAKDLAASDASAKKTLTTIERQIKNNYKAAYQTLNAVFSDIYSKFEVDGKLTYEEMQKYNRFKNMQTELNATLTEMYVADKKVLNNGLSTMYADGYYQTGYAIEKEVQSKLSYVPLDAERIKAAVQNPISGLTLDQTLSKHRLDIISKIDQEVTRGLIQGNSYGKMSKAIRETLGNDFNKSIRVAHTEAHRVQNAARLESAKHADDIGVDMAKVWVSTLDSKTRSTHQSLDGQEVGVDENFTSSSGASGPAPGQLGTAAEDIFCRCSFIIQVAGVKPEFRRVRGEGVVPYTTYPEWAEAHGMKHAAAMPAPARVAPVKAAPAVAAPVKAVKPKAPLSAPSTVLTEDGMKSKLGVDGVYLDWLDEPMKNSYLTGMNRMASEFPDLKGVVGKVKTVKDKTDSIAEFVQQMGGNELQISAQYSSNAENLNSLFAKQIKSGFFPKTWANGNSAEYTITHEMAHSLETRLTLKSLNLKDMPEYVWEWQPYKEKWGSVSADIVSQAVKSTGIKKDVLGKYAMVNDSEAFAQGISDALLSPNPSKLSLEILKLAKGRFK